MSRIQSPVKKINDLWIEPLPSGSAVAIQRAIKVDGVTFLLGKNGKVYCDRLTTRRGCYLLAKYRWVLPLVRGLSRLGLITKAEAQQHIDACALASLKSEQEGIISDFIKSARKLNIPITAKHRAAFRKAKPQS